MRGKPGCGAMDWRDEGTLIAVRPHGETSAIAEIFTRAHGLHSGVVRGGASRRLAPHLQPGTRLDVSWRARLETQIGVFSVEPHRARAGILADRLGLLGLNAICALLRVTLAERHAHPGLYARTEALFDALDAPAGSGLPAWSADYLRWEMRLLEDLGFGLDLSRCAVSGTREDLVFVSPKTGRAISRAAAGEWADRLFALPQVLLGQGGLMPGEAGDGLRITGHFLERAAGEMAHRPLPAARGRLTEALPHLIRNRRSAM